MFNHIMKKITMISILTGFVTANSITNDENNFIPDGVGETYISGFNFQNKKITYLIDGELAIFEGDILLGTTEEADNWLDAHENNLNIIQNNNQQNGVVITGQRFRWKNNTLIYQYDSTVTQSTKGVVFLALEHWKQKTPIRFIERTTQNAHLYPDYVSISSKERNVCRSRVGRRGGAQNMNIGKTWCSPGTIIHEFGHALGLWHEQSREDRNQFIKINFDNIRRGLENNFNQQIQNGTDIGRYDYASIMHYGTSFFTSNGLPTIEVLQPGITIGQRESLSTGDIATIKKIYPTQTSNTPNAPTLLKVKSIQTTTAKISFKDNAINETNFRVFANGKMIGRYNPKNQTGIVNLTLRHLIPNTTYNVTIVAHNKFSNSNKSNIITFRTKDTIETSDVPKTPTLLKVKSTQSTTAKIFFRDNATNETDFRVFANEKMIGRYNPKNQTGIVNLTLRHLTPNTTYNVTIVAHNKFADSAKSNQVVLKTSR